MENAKTADWAATVPWDGIVGKPPSVGGKTDVGQLTAKGYAIKQVPQWNGVRFIGVNPQSLVDTSGLYGPNNKPYDITQFSWNPGTLTPFLRTTKTIDLNGVTDGLPVAVGVPYDLQGCLISVDTEVNTVNITIFNSTPYDVTLASGVWAVLTMK